MIVQERGPEHHRIVASAVADTEAAAWGRGWDWGPGVCAVGGRVRALLFNGLASVLAPRPSGRLPRIRDLTPKPQHPPRGTNIPLSE